MLVIVEIDIQKRNGPPARPRGIYTLLHKSPDMHYVKHKLVKNTLPSHHVKHDDTRVSPNCRRAEKQAVSRHSGWLDLS
jgi:azurin